MPTLELWVPFRRGAVMVCNLEIDIGKDDSRSSYPILIRGPGGAEASGRFRLDVDAILARRGELQNSILLSTVAATRSGSPDGVEATVRDVGQLLFVSLLQDRVYGQYVAARTLAASRGEPLRVILRLAAPELAGLPWEMLYDEEHDAYLCKEQPLIRHVAVPTPPPPTVTGRLRILGMVASPSNLMDLDVDGEKARLETALSSLRQRVELFWTPSGTWSDLLRVLTDGPWHVIHFIGHGDFDHVSGHGRLALEGEDTRAHWVQSDRVRDLLSIQTPPPRLVVLNSCASGQAGANDLFSSTAATIVRGGACAVVAMQYAITDEGAKAFAVTLYQAIASNHTISESVRIARIGIAGPDRSLEWATPVLYLRGDGAQDTQLFTVIPSPATPGDAPGQGSSPRASVFPQPDGMTEGATAAKSSASPQVRDTPDRLPSDHGNAPEVIALAAEASGNSVANTHSEGSVISFDPLITTQPPVTGRSARAEPRLSKVAKPAVTSVAATPSGGMEGTDQTDVAPSPSKTADAPGAVRRSWFRSPYILPVALCVLALAALTTFVVQPFSRSASSGTSQPPVSVASTTSSGSTASDGATKSHPSPTTSSTANGSRSAAAGVALPGAVGALAASEITTTSLRVSWSPASGATGYHISWRDVDATRIWSTSADGVASQTSTLLTELVSGHTYAVRVTPFNNAGSGTARTVTAQLPKPPVPGGSELRLDDWASTTLTVHIGPATGATGYRLEYTLEDATVTQTVVTDKPGKVTLSGLEPSSTYLIRVTPFNASGDGPASDLQALTLRPST